ncbi:hypothetical protein [Pseudomonas sp. NPDC089569]|uniref:hypothetical protein n=1 Tax=Pseudomonas sp. NPDC089569 TaxID=3390722 RepID=UPI003D091B68
MNVLLSFLVALGLMVFAFCCPGLLAKRSEVMFKGQEIAAVLGLILALVCAVFVWLLSTPDTLFAKAYLN